MGRREFSERTGETARIFLRKIAGLVRLDKGNSVANGSGQVPEGYYSFPLKEVVDRTRDPRYSSSAPREAEADGLLGRIENGLQRRINRL